MNHFEDKYKLNFPGRSCGKSETNLQGHLRSMKMSGISNYDQNANKGFERFWKHYRQLKHMQRLSGIPKIQSYSVMEHCYRTAILFEHFMEMEEIARNADNSHWVLSHDLLESVTGDLLYPAKNYNETTKLHWTIIETQLTSKLEEFDYLYRYTDKNARIGFSEKEWTIFKACDLLELIEFCQEETELGNKSRMITKIRAQCVDIVYDFGIKSIIAWLEK